VQTENQDLSRAGSFPESYTLQTHSKATSSKPSPLIPLPLKEVIADALKVKPPKER